jgi:copper resistance protein C
MDTRNKRRFWPTFLAALVALAAARSAWAHAGYVRSAPGENAVVAEAPAQVEIWVSQDLFRRQGENWIRVTGPDGAEAHAGEAVIDDDDRRHMTVALAAGLPAGEYTVAWRTLSAEDGDNDEGSFTFTVDPQAQETSTPMSAITPTVVPQSTGTAAAAMTPTPADRRTGCGFGLAPAMGLMAAAGWGALAGRRRKA